MFQFRSTSGDRVRIVLLKAIRLPAAPLEDADEAGGVGAGLAPGRGGPHEKRAEGRLAGGRFDIGPRMGEPHSLLQQKSLPLVSLDREGEKAGLPSARAEAARSGLRSPK